MNFYELLWREAWLSPVILNIKKVIETTEVKSIGITPDGKTMLYNSDYWNSLSHEEQIGVQLHEILHIINLHSKRGEGKAKDLWNAACDMAINFQILSSGYTLPQGVLISFNDNSAENIYKGFTKTKNQNSGEILNKFKCNSQRNNEKSNVKPDNKSEAKDNEGLEKDANSKSGNKANDDPLSGDLLNKNLNDSKNEFDIETYEAIEAAGKLAGKGTSKLSKKFIIPKHKADWKATLNALIKSAIGDEYDYISYEFDEFGVCEDILSLLKKPKICVLIDESASVSDDLFGQFLAELNRISKYAEIFVSGFTDNTELNAVPLAKYKRTMSGGTCVLRAYNEAIESDFYNIIILTDGYLTFPEKELKPTIWVLPKSFKRKNEVII